MNHHIYLSLALALSVSPVCADRSIIDQIGNAITHPISLLFPESIQVEKLAQDLQDFNSAYADCLLLTQEGTVTEELITKAVLSYTKHEKKRLKEKLKGYSLTVVKDQLDRRIKKSLKEQKAALKAQPFLTFTKDLKHNRKTLRAMERLCKAQAIDNSLQAREFSTLAQQCRTLNDELEVVLSLVEPNTHYQNELITGRLAFISLSAAAAVAVAYLLSEPTAVNDSSLLI